jgi:hypothetical protein
MASEDDFLIARRFESLDANTILWMQHRIHVYPSIGCSEVSTPKISHLRNRAFRPKIACMQAESQN